MISAQSDESTKRVTKQVQTDLTALDVYNMQLAASKRTEPKFITIDEAIQRLSEVQDLTEHQRADLINVANVLCPIPTSLSAQVRESPDSATITIEPKFKSPHEVVPKSPRPGTRVQTGVIPPPWTPRNPMSPTRNRSNNEQQKSGCCLVM